MINENYSIDIYRINNPQAGKANDIFADCTRDPLCSNPVCDPSLSVRDRAAGLVNVLNIEEKLDTLVDKTPGVPRLGIWPYEWWSEALHGLAYAPGNEFEDSGNFSSATSFPMPIVMAASFNDDLVFAIGEAISIEARAYANAGLNGFDFYVSVPETPKSTGIPVQDTNGDRGYRLRT
jgi:beta-D-xylosidase 4